MLLPGTLLLILVAGPALLSVAYVFIWPRVARRRVPVLVLGLISGFILSAAGLLWVLNLFSGIAFYAGPSNGSADVLWPVFLIRECAAIFGVLVGSSLVLIGLDRHPARIKSESPDATRGA